MQYVVSHSRFHTTSSKPTELVTPLQRPFSVACLPGLWSALTSPSRLLPPSPPALTQRNSTLVLSSVWIMIIPARHTVHMIGIFVLDLSLANISRPLVFWISLALRTSTSTPSSSFASTTLMRSSSSISTSTSSNLSRLVCGLNWELLPFKIAKPHDLEYEREGINWKGIEFTDNQKTLDLIEKKPIGIFALLGKLHYC